MTRRQSSHLGESSTEINFKSENEIFKREITYMFDVQKLFQLKF